MTLERANEKSLRITGLDEENDVKIYLIMVNTNKCSYLFITNFDKLFWQFFFQFLFFLYFCNVFILIQAGPKDIQQLYTAIDRRIRSLKQSKDQQNLNDSNSDDTKEKAENVNSKKDTEIIPTSSSEESQIAIGDDANSSIRSQDVCSDDE